MRFKLGIKRRYDNKYVVRLEYLFASLNSVVCTVYMIHMIDVCPRPDPWLTCCCLAQRWYISISYLRYDTLGPLRSLCTTYEYNTTATDRSRYDTFILEYKGPRYPSDESPSIPFSAISCQPRYLHLHFLHTARTSRQDGCLVRTM